MKIVNEVLSEELFQKCWGEFKSKLNERCWSSSLFTWEPILNKGICGSCLAANVSDELSELIYKEIKSYLPEHDKIWFSFYVWQSLSGIAKHDDNHVIFGATIYLNEEWDPDAGGWFVWEDDETKKSGIHKALIPKGNMMVLNDNRENHWVTSIAANAPEWFSKRYSIQIWGCDDS